MFRKMFSSSIDFGAQKSRIDVTTVVTTPAFWSARCSTKNLLRTVPVNKVREFEKDYLDTLERKHKNVLNDLKAGKYTDEITNNLEACAKELTAKYN
jgi:F0F1-type ATP synthase alpha subunit